jgi:hypothetical protein
VARAAVAARSGAFPENHWKVLFSLAYWSQEGTEQGLAVPPPSLSKIGLSAFSYTSNFWLKNIMVALKL